jgi:hypothetical protein
MDNSGIIRIAGHKTNSDYLREVSVQQWRPDFARLADAFDFVWYGEYPISKNMFVSYQEIVKHLIRQMTTS